MKNKIAFKIDGTESYCYASFCLTIHLHRQSLRLHCVIHAHILNHRAKNGLFLLCGFFRIVADATDTKFFPTEHIRMCHGYYMQVK